jgi:phosphoglycerate dehydrogenase-like enzyme
MGTPEALDAMRSAGHEVLVRNAPHPVDPTWLAAQMGGLNATVVAMEPIRAAGIAAADRLRIIARPGVGYDTVDIETATERGVIVTIAAGANAQSVADFSFGLLLEATREIGATALGVRQGTWKRVTGVEAWGKTLAIIGLGEIGRGVARRARGFDMKVLAVSRTRDESFAKHNGIRYVELDDALSQADFVSLHLPLTPTTQNLIDARALARMKRGAYLINTSRGALVDEAALADAVRGGHLAGAAVDVLRTQGTRDESPLIDVPGILVTPHMASLTREAGSRVAMSVARSVISALQGIAPEHVVNPAAWE